MASTGIVRHLDELGRIVIPKETRQILGLRDHDPLEILLADGQLVLQRYAPGCLFCGASTTTIVFKGRNVCRRCLADARRSK
ncbi:MAG: AbrB/MazE/SpoVT family DNA-binding domain-containing protein [Bacteroidota bacterium]